eukprot:11057972-Ditylum_brightwellii.AAC.1
MEKQNQLCLMITTAWSLCWSILCVAIATDGENLGNIWMLFVASPSFLTFKTKNQITSSQTINSYTEDGDESHSITVLGIPFGSKENVNAELEKFTTTLEEDTNIIANADPDSPH